MKLGVFYLVLATVMLVVAIMSITQSIISNSIQWTGIIFPTVLLVFSLYQGITRIKKAKKNVE